jgi:hypothetical protein
MTPAFSRGDTVKRIIDDKLGTVLDGFDASARVAFIGRDRPTVVPVTELSLVDMSYMDMLNEWQADASRISAHFSRTNKYYDEAPDGSMQKRDALSTMDYLSHRRSLVEGAQVVLVDLID